MKGKGLAIFIFINLLFSCTFVPGTEISAPIEIKPQILVKSGSNIVELNAQVDFGSILTNSTKSINFTIENPGWEDLQLTGSSTIDISNTSFFSLPLTPSALIEKQSNTSFSIQFNPGANTSLQTATITIQNTSPDIPAFTFTIKAIASAAPASDISLRQNSTSINQGGTFSLGSVVKGTTGSETIFTIENLGTSTLNLTGALTSDNTQFQITSQPALTTLAPSESTTFKARFSPTASGAQSATITIPNDDADEGPNFTFTLTGTGTIALIEIEQASTPITYNATGYDFGLLNISAGTQSITFTIRNTGDAPLHLSGTPVVSLSGSNAYSITSQPASTTITPGASTTFILKFNPAAATPIPATTHNTQISLSSDADNYATYIFNATGIGTTTTTFTSNYNSEDDYIKATNLSGSGAILGTYKTTYGLGVGEGADGMANRSILSFNTAGLPDGATLTKAYFTGKYSYGSYYFSANPWEDPSTPNNLLIDVKTGYFGSSPSVAAEDFTAVATTDAAAQLDYFSTGSKQSTNFSAAGLTAINKTGQTQLRLRFESQHTFTNYLFIEYGTNALLTVEYYQ